MSLEVQQIEPGFWRWTVPHPEWTPDKDKPGGWGQRVGCVYHEGPDAVVLIDPLAPAEGTPERERFWEALDADIDLLDLPVAVILANHYHLRSASDIRARYEPARPANVWAHEQARSQLPAAIVTRFFRDHDVLPGGVHAHAIPGLTPDETILWIPSRKTLVAADAILGAGNGELRVAPLSWADKSAEGARRYEAEFRPRLRELLDLPFERVLVAHGEPVLAGGHAALARALDSPPWGT
jgi:glyoxylase-like metal-dependent hydrolase (beta-lactamase superfamily II)